MELKKNQISTEDYEATIITLEYDDGTEEDCALVAVFDGVPGYMVQYAALIPVDKDDDEEDTEMYLYRYEESGEDEYELEAIEDEIEFNAVSERFYDLMDENDIETFNVERK